MNLQAIVVANSFGIILMLMLLTSVGKNIRRHDAAERIFYGMIWATILLCAGEMSEFLIDGRQFPCARLLNYLLNTVVFSINILFAFLWTVYIDYKLFEPGRQLRKRHIWMAVPMAAVLVMVVLNFFLPVIFTVSAANVYARTPLTVVPFLVSFFYLGYSELAIYTSKSNDRRYLFMPSVIFLLPIMAAGVLQMLFYGLSLIWAALAISVASIYINVQCEFSSVDALSGVYTRQYLDSYLREHAEGRHGYEGMMFDLDRFKSINDTLGHQCGDAAIRDFGRILRAAADGRDIIARYGGDEFVIIRKNGRGGSLRELADQLEKQVDAFNGTAGRPYKLNYSYGIAKFVPGRDTTDDFLRRMDDSMYRCKKARSMLLPDRRGREGQTL